MAIKSKQSEQSLNLTPPKKTSGRLRKSIIAVVVAAIVLLCFTLGHVISCIVIQNSRSKAEEILDVVKEYGILLNLSPIDQSLTEEQQLKALVEEMRSQDAYSQYFTAEEYKEYQNKSVGKYSGIGISFNSASYEVTNVVGNSPAEDSGIRAGDKIVAGKYLEQQFTQFSGEDEFETFINSVPDNQEFTLKIDRGLGNQKQVTLAKTNFKASYVKYYDNSKVLNFMSENITDYKTYQTNIIDYLPDDTALIKIDSFYGDMVNQFKGATGLMKSLNKTKLILDLRSNGGGSVNVMLKLCELLIDNGGKRYSTILYAKDKQGNFSKYVSNKNEYLEFLTKIVVLADKNTASASECLINAMLYYGKFDNNFSKENLVIAKSGDTTARTFGKGIMQKYFSLSDASVLKITTSTLYAPDKSTCIHNIGITTTQQNGVINSQVLPKALEIING